MGLFNSIFNIIKEKFKISGFSKKTENYEFEESYLPNLSKNVYTDCLIRFGLPSTTVSKIYGRFENNLLAILERAKIDTNINDINSVLSVAIKLFFDEFMSTQNDNTRTEENDTLHIHGKKQEDINKIPYELFYDFYMATHESSVEYQHNMGEKYQYGYQVKRNYSKMFSWYEVAAKNGSIPAMLDLYACYAFLKRDDDSSIYWLIEAAERDDCYALYSLHLEFGNVNGFSHKIKKYYHDKELSGYCLMRAAYLHKDELAEIWNNDSSYIKVDLETTKINCELLSKHFPMKYPDGKIDLRSQLKQLRLNNLTI